MAIDRRALVTAGSWCSSEMGLLGIDPWRGQFHMEMVWWHLAHYALWDRWDTGIYHLAPAMPPSELGITRDTVFDLAYWRWGLDKAQEWRQRLGLARVPLWDEVRKHLAPLPVVDGHFVHSAEWTDTYTKRAGLSGQRELDCVLGGAPSRPLRCPARWNGLTEAAAAG